MSWTLIFSRHSLKDAKKLKQANLWKRAERLIEVLRSDPFQTPPPYEKLVGELKGVYSRRINVQHRLVYDVSEKDRIVRILRMWSHYE